MRPISNIIVQGGLLQQEAQDYDDRNVMRDYMRRQAKHGIERMDYESALMPGRRENELLKQQIQRNEQQYKLRSQPAEIEHRTAMEPGKRRLEVAEQQQELAQARQKQAANLWLLYRSGDEPGALELLNNSQMVAPGRKFSKIVRGTAPMQGEDGKPVVGADGQPQTQEVARFVAADGEKDIFMPTQTLDQLAQRHLGSTKVVGNSVLQFDAFGGVKPVYEPKRQTSVPAGGAVAVDGKITDTNIAGVEAKSEAKIREIKAQGALKKSLAEFRNRNGVQKATALERNMQMLVESGVAADHAEAYQKLRTGMGKSPEDQTLSLASTLMRGSAYRGKDGANRAFQDAARMVGEMRGARTGDAGAGADASAPVPRPGGSAPKKYQIQNKTFTDADIEATAKKYGITPDQVKQRLGIR